MGLCPDNDISGGKILWTGTRKVKNRLAAASRMAAQSLQGSQSALGEFYSMQARLGAPKAITATAHKLAHIIYHMLTPANRTTRPYSPASKSDIVSGSRTASKHRRTRSDSPSFWRRHLMHEVLDEVP